MACKQKLSPKAKKAKAKRDLAYAKTADRRKKKAHAQRERRRAKRSEKNVDGKDWDHKDGRWRVLLGIELMMGRERRRRVKRNIRYLSASEG